MAAHLATEFSSARLLRQLAAGTIVVTGTLGLAVIPAGADDFIGTPGDGNDDLYGGPGGTDR